MPRYASLSNNEKQLSILVGSYWNYEYPDGVEAW